MKQKKVLLVYTNFSSFVKADYEILSSEFQVTRYPFKPVKGIPGTFWQLFRQFNYLLFYIRRFDFAFIWFADTHAFLPVFFCHLLKKKTAVAIGGYDAVSIPELKYGLYCSNRLRQFFGKYVIKNADYLLPVDGSLIENTNYFADKTGKGLPVGIRSFVPHIKGKIIVAPTGFNPEFWKPVEGIVRENSVVTVAAVVNWQRWHLKGCDFLAQIAAKMPDLPFHIYGVSPDMIKELEKTRLPGNLFLHGFASTNELPSVYSRHTIYAQLSLSEGFPNVLCEAMLCGCIPVGSDVNGIPGVIQNKKLILNRQDITQAIQILKYAASLESEDRATFRNSVISRFQINKRVSLIISLMQ